MPTDTIRSAQARPPLIAALGGARGLLDGGTPPLLFVAVNAIAGAETTRPVALAIASTVAVGTGLAVVILRRARRQPTRQAVAGLAGLVIAVLFAAGSGEARAFFLPGIWVDAAYAVAFAVSAVIGRPLAGIAYGLIFGRRGLWREDARLRRAFTVATVLWALVYATRALVQALFYQGDRPGLLAAGKLLLGWPLTFLAAALTLALVRRATRGRAPQKSPTSS
jgi:hypothetical protein